MNIYNRMLLDVFVILLKLSITPGTDQGCLKYEVKLLGKNKKYWLFILIILWEDFRLVGR